MNFDVVMDLLQKSINQQYGKNVQIDIPRFKHDLITVYGVNLNSINIPLNMLMAIILKDTSLTDYANLYGVSYSSIQKNTIRYVTLVTKGKQKYIAQYELLHSKRMTENYGKKTEYLVQKNDKLREKLMEESYNSNKEVSSVIYNILKKYYNI